jgi:ubiquinone/menaquinone biosynthesis C-methylase UbiE
MNTARSIPVIPIPPDHPPARTVREQFGNPSGWLGDLVGRVMASSNVKRSKWVLSLLGLEPHHHVLEVGFGPGVDVERSAAVITTGIVAGVDHSPTMFRMASERNAAAIAEGRVHLEVASAADLPFDDASFDRIYSINCVQFLPDLRRCVGEARRVLVPGGRVAMAIQPRQRGAADPLVWRERLETTLRQAGFATIEIHTARTRPTPTVCALAQRPHRPR